MLVISRLKWYHNTFADVLFANLLIHGSCLIFLLQFYFCHINIFEEPWLQILHMVVLQSAVLNMLQYNVANITHGSVTILCVNAVGR